jgi:hypothetical protein
VEPEVGDVLPALRVVGGDAQAAGEAAVGGRLAVGRYERRAEDQRRALALELGEQAEAPEGEHHDREADDQQAEGERQRDAGDPDGEGHDRAREAEQQVERVGRDLAQPRSRSLRRGGHCGGHGHVGSVGPARSRGQRVGSRAGVGLTTPPYPRST